MITRSVKYLMFIVVGSFMILLSFYYHADITDDGGDDNGMGGVIVPDKVDNFEDCEQAGNTILESYPRQCISGDETFTEVLSDEQLAKENLIRVYNPRLNQRILSPLVIEGEARGYWFFEASFPVVLVDWDGLIIADGIAQAVLSGDETWMTEDFVKFKAELTFKKPSYKDNGALILRKDNPSGLPENDDSLEIPIFFE